MHTRRSGKCWQRRSLESDGKSAAGRMGGETTKTGGDSETVDGGVAQARARLLLDRTLTVSNRRNGHGSTAELKSKLARVAELKAIADRDFTPEEVKEIGELDARVKEPAPKSGTWTWPRTRSRELRTSRTRTTTRPPARSPEARQTAPRFERQLVKSFGHAFVESERYKEFQKAFPSGVGSGSPVDIGRVKVGSMSDYFARRKSSTLGTGDVHIQPVRMPTVDMVDRNRLTFLDLVSRQTAGNFEYVQVTGIARGAAVSRRLRAIPAPRRQPA